MIIIIKSRTGVISVLNEYVVLIPAVIILNYYLINKIRCYKKRQAKLERLKSQIKQRDRINRILEVIFGMRGGSLVELRQLNEIVGVNSLECGVPEGVSYLDNKKLRQLILSLFKHKTKRNIIAISSKALCYFAETYRDKSIFVPVALFGSHVGLNSIYQTVRKTAATLILGLVPSLWFMSGVAPLSAAFVLLTLGLRLAYHDLDIISTTPIVHNSFFDIKQRIPGLTDIVIFNNRKQITMTEVEMHECLLPGQKIFDRNCNKQMIKIQSAIDVAHTVDYNDAITLKDAIGLKGVEFDDIFDFGPPKKLPKSKRVNFLDKFPSSEKISESDTWYPSEPPTPNLRVTPERAEEL